MRKTSRSWAGSDEYSRSNPDDDAPRTSASARSPRVIVGGATRRHETPRRIGELHRALRVAAGELGNAEAEVAGLPTGLLEPVHDDRHDIGAVERKDADEVSLRVERLLLVGEQRAHHRWLRPSEHDAEPVVVRLEVGSEQSGCAMDPIDAGELVEHEQHGRLRGELGDDVQLGVHRHQWIGARAGRLAQLDADESEVELDSGGEPPDPLVGRAGRREGHVEAGGEIGHRRDLVEIDPDDDRARRGDVGGHPAQDAGLAEAARSEQRGEAVLTHSLDEVGDELIVAADEDRIEWALIRERRNVHGRHGTA